MENLFAEGGVNTGTVDMDPISGNEVPPGSMPEEVRDDIDAKLSGGEYVVPADVLRFFGVAFFEDLRRKAKEGLAEMDADGRIGGGMPEEDNDDDFPFSVEELQTENNFAEGGMVTPTGSFNPSDWSFGGGFSDANPTGSGFSSIKKYRDKDGNIVNVLIVDGKPIVDVQALGYTEYKEDTPVGTGEKVATPEVQRESSSDRDLKPEEDSKPIDPSKNYYNLTESELLNPEYGNMFGDKAGTIAKAGSILDPGLGLGVGLVSGIQQANNLADARARQIIAKERGLDTTALDAKIKKMEEDASGFVKTLDLVGLDGTGIAKRHKQGFGAVAPGTSTRTTTAKTGLVSKPSGSSSSSGSGSGSGGRSSSDDRDSGYQAPTATKTVSTPSGTKTVSATPTTTGTRSYTAPTTQELRDQKATSAGVNVGGYNATATNRIGPQARGGLINKPQKVAKLKTKRKTKI